jgi:hypothetical protein
MTDRRESDSIPPTVHAQYLRDLGYLIREAGEQASKTARESRAAERDFENGQAFAYVAVLTLMQQQAHAFRLPLSDLALDGLDPERDLLT